MAEAAYTKVSIQGDEYRVSGDAPGPSIPDLATFVDHKMEEVRRRSKNTFDAKRIAVLTALNLADELFRERERAAAEAARVRERLAALGFALEETLTEPEPGCGGEGSSGILA